MIDTPDPRNQRALNSSDTYTVNQDGSVTLGDGTRGKLVDRVSGRPVDPGQTLGGPQTSRNNSQGGAGSEGTRPGQTTTDPSEIQLDGVFGLDTPRTTTGAPQTRITDQGRPGQSSRQGTEGIQWTENPLFHRKRAANIRKNAADRASNPGVDPSTRAQANQEAVSSIDTARDQMVGEVSAALDGGAPNVGQSGQRWHERRWVRLGMGFAALAGIAAPIAMGAIALARSGGSEEDPLDEELLKEIMQNMINEEASASSLNSLYEDRMRVAHIDTVSLRQQLETGSISISSLSEDEVLALMLDFTPDEVIDTLLQGGFTLDEIERLVMHLPRESVHHGNLGRAVDRRRQNRSGGIWASLGNVWSSIVEGISGVFSG